MNYLRASAFAGTLAMLTACVDPVAQLEKYDPQSVDFASALAGEYLQYAEAQKELGNDTAARYFGKKGLTATQGWEVEPEMVTATTPAVEKPALDAARARLLRALNKKAHEVEILKAARAQMMFDCWAFAAASGDKDTTATCRDAFGPAVEELERAVGLRAPKKRN